MSFYSPDSFEFLPALATQYSNLILNYSTRPGHDAVKVALEWSAKHQGLAESATQECRNIIMVANIDLSKVRSTYPAGWVVD